MADHGDIVERIVALLAQAESTTFEEERQSFLAGAARLMAKHRIDQATIDGARVAEEDPGWDTWVYSTDGRNLSAKRMLITLACEIAGGGTTGGFLDTNLEGTIDGQEWAGILGYPVERTVARLTYVSLLKLVFTEATNRQYTHERVITSFAIGFARALHDKIERARRVEEMNARRIDDDSVVARAALVLVDERARKVADLAPDAKAMPVDMDQVHRGVFEHGYAVGERAELDLGIHERLDTPTD